MAQRDVQLGEAHLTAARCVQLAEGQLRGVLSAGTCARVASARAQIERLLKGSDAVYGVNTGFGPLCNTRIARKDLLKLQHNLLLSHSVGVGEAAPRPVVRLMLASKVHALAKGHSGVSEALIRRLLWHLQRDHLPRVPIQGSVGASGDLAPLAHLALPLIGQGELWVKDQYVPAEQVLAKHQLKPLQLQAKEALALINGTQFMLSYALWALQRSWVCLEMADVIAAMSLAAYGGSAAPFDPHLHALRPFDGVQYVAQRVAVLLSDADVPHHAPARIQDPYSFRCMPQVHGAARAAWRHLRDQITCELNAVTDNPVLVQDTKKRMHALSGGHFHGEPIALPINYAAMAIAELGSISERRSFVLSKGDPPKLPPTLAPNPGLHSGLMMPQYTAASLVSENKSLAYPTATDSIPTGADQEDHVSMGAHGSRQLLQIVHHIEQILGIEMLYALQATHLRHTLPPKSLLGACYAHARTQIPPLTHDRPLTPDLHTAIQIIQQGQWIQLIHQKHPTPIGKPFHAAYQWND